RIRFPPADSPCLARTGPLQVATRGFPAGVRCSAGGTVGRDAQGLSTSRQLPTISLSGPFPVPQCRLSGSPTVVAPARQARLGSRSDQALGPVRLKQCQARSAARASQVADVNVPAARLWSDDAA